MTTSLSVWQPVPSELLPSSAVTPSEIASYAAQLSNRDRQQIVAAFQSGHYEIALNYLWGKTIRALKKELSSVGVGLLAEMLGRTDADEDDDVDDIVTDKDAVRLAEELGIVNSTDAMRLRHSHEMIAHFSNIEVNYGESYEIDATEALSALKSCVRGVLGRPKVEVAKKFVEFRSALEGRTLSENDPQVDMLRGSPYFFYKLTVSVLLNGAKKNTGANLEHILANTNVLIPAMWPSLREAERWQIGHNYAEAYSDGKTTVVGGLKSALLKVRGFDYVPENLRSDTFIKAAEAIIAAHEGMNNFYNEPSHVKHLTKLGSTIPIPALPACMTALLCVVLGNRYGVAWGAHPDAMGLLKKISNDRWQYYFNNVLPGEVRILRKIMDDKPRSNWMDIVSDLGLDEIDVKLRSMEQLLGASVIKDASKVTKSVSKLIDAYYGHKN